MKKITEELNRYNSINQYISEQFGSSLNEAETPLQFKVRNVYNKITNGFWGPGTNPDEIINALNEITTKEEFLALNNWFVTKKPDGYKSFQDMVNGELEYDGTTNSNKIDLDKIFNKLKELGINSTIGKDATTGKYKKGSYKITLPTQTTVVDPKTTTTDQQGTVVNKKQPAKISPVLQQTMSINKQIQQKTGVTPTGKLTHADLEKLIGMLRPAATTSTSGEITPAGTVASTQTTPTASTLPQQQK